MEWATAESIRPTKSTFVTVVAWIFIALDGLGAFILLVENIVINTILPFDQLQEGMARAQNAGKLPATFAWVFGHVQPLLFIFLLYTLIKLVAAIGLLNRWNWARFFFIGILALGVVWSFAGIVMQQFMISSMPVPPNAPKDFESAMQGMMIAIRVFSAFFAVGFAVLYGWMIKKLLSPAIAAEFSVTPNAVGDS